MTGLWANVDPMEVAHISVWRRDPARFWAFYGQRFAMLDGKEPNGAHRALVELERRGLVSRRDHAEHRRPARARRARATRSRSTARSAPPRACRAARRTRWPRRARGSPRTTDGVPRCDCGAPLKPDVVLFGELLPEAAMARATELAAGAGLMLAIGSSLEVYPVAGLPADTLPPAAGSRS